MVRALYTVRWQIELIFKQLNSIVQIHHSATTKLHRLRCELYGKLMVAVWVHRLHARGHIALWNTTRRELSMEKVYKRLQERAFLLTQLCLVSWDRASAYWTRTPAPPPALREIPTTLTVLHARNAGGRLSFTAMGRNPALQKPE